MTANRSCAGRRSRLTRAIFALTAAVALLSPQVVTPLAMHAQEIVPDPRRPDSLLAPIADLVSASSWLMISGQDPRFSFVGFAGGAVDAAQPGVATPEADGAEPANGRDGSLVVTPSLGSVGVNASPAMAVDPSDPGHIVLGVSDLDLPSVATYASFDGGATWEGPRQAPYFEGDRGAAGAASLAFAGNGDVYLASLSIGMQPYQLGNAAFAAPAARVVVSRSTDGGLTWDDPASAARAGVAMSTMVDESGRVQGDVRTGFVDSPSLAAGPDPARPGSDILYLAYTEFTVRYPIQYAGEVPVYGAPAIESVIRVVRSMDGGQTWSTPLAVSPRIVAGGWEPSAGAVPAPPGAPTPGPSAPPEAPSESGPTFSSDQVVQGPRLAVLGDGSVILAYFDSTADGIQRGLARVAMATSRDGGSTFTEPVPAGVFREIARSPRTLPLRWWSSGFPRVAVGPDDEVLIAVTAKPAERPTDDGDILLLRSRDGGASWEAPAAIDAGTATGAQFFPEIAVSPDGVLHATWADTGDDPSGVRFELRHAEASDGGAAWSASEAGAQGAPANGRVPGNPVNALLAYAGGRYLGDRFALAPAGNDLYVAWVATGIPGEAAPRQSILVARYATSSPGHGGTSASMPDGTPHANP